MTLKTPFLTLFRSKIDPPTPKTLKNDPCPRPYFDDFDDFHQNHQNWRQTPFSRPVHVMYTSPKIGRKTLVPVKTTIKCTHYPMYTCTRYSPRLSTHKCTTLHVPLCTSYNDLTNLTTSHFSSPGTRAERKKHTPLDAYTRTREMHDFLKTPKTLKIG